MRWVGLVLVVGAAALIGHGLARERERRVAQLGALLHSLEALETEVVYGLTYLREAFQRIAREYPECRALFRRAARGLEAGETARTAWKEALAAYRRSASLTAEDLLPLERIGGVLGLSAAADQERHLRLVRRELEARLAEARGSLPQATRLYRTLGLFCGLAVALLLL